MLFARPTITVMLPSRLSPGGRCEGEVVLTASRPFDIDFIDLRVTGQSYNYVVKTRSTGKSTTTYRSYRRQSELELAARLREAGKLAEGVTRLPFTFELPPTLPPSFAGPQCGTEYTVSVHVSIPWWPDARATFTVPVEPRGEAPPPSHPVIVSSHPDGPVAGELQFELSLDSDTITPGGEIQGAAAFQNLDVARRPDRLKFEFVQRAELIRDDRNLAVEHTPHALELALEDLHNGAPVPFRLPVPALSPTWNHPLYAAGWTLRVTAVRGLLARDLKYELPVRVIWLAPGARVVQAAPPVVGTERERQVFAYVAERRHLAQDEAGVLHGRRGAVAFDVAPTRADKGRAAVGASLTFPRLGLGLVAGEASRLAWLRGSKPFDGRFHPRDAAQAEGFLAQLAQAVGDDRVEHLSDTRMIVTRDGARSVRALEAFVGAVEALAERLEHAGATLPLPAGTEARATEFGALAAALHGRLVRAAMAVDAPEFILEGESAIEACFDAEGRATPGLRVRFRPHQRLDPGYALERTAGHDAGAWPGAWPTGARDLAEGLLRAGATLRVGPEELSLELPEAPAELTETARTRLEQLATLARALSGAMGGYR